MVALPHGKKIWRHVQRCWQNTGVWQTDGQTSCDGIVRAMHTRRVVKMNETILMQVVHMARAWDNQLREPGGQGWSQETEIRSGSLAEASFSTRLGLSSISSHLPVHSKQIGQASIELEKNAMCYVFRSFHVTRHECNKYVRYVYACINKHCDTYKVFQKSSPPPKTMGTRWKINAIWWIIKINW